MSEFKDYTGYMMSPKIDKNWLGYFKDGIYQYSTNSGRIASHWHASNDPNLKVADVEIPASDEFTLKALKREALRRGFKKGVEFKPHNSMMVYTMASDNIEFGYYSNKNCLHVEGNYGLIFENGNWAEIIKE